ncbi:MAG TPA: M48 family metallopeptidase [Methylotenera sp.]|nr:M48 family metallopeptidase [Methylotenera sp.]HPV44414.1 M48 family metallopeptidase [Methylotenera sp.]
MRKISMNKLLMGLLVTAGVFSALSIPPAQALDLGKALEEAVKSKVEEVKNGGETPSTPAAEAAPAAPVSTTTNASPVATTEPTPASAQPEFNWKKPSKEEEIALGREITGSLLGAAPLVKDEALQKYVNQVGRWVANQSERADLPWKFGVIDSNDINAFAAPGGYVLITKGLYQKLHNEAQLAGVLGHEIAHVVKKHQLKVLQKQQLLNIGAGKLSDLFSKNDKLAKKAISSGAEISARSLDKTAEFEADRMGMVLATRAGYDAYGLPDVLQTIGQTNKNDDSVALLFKTHPHPDERLTKLGDSAGSSFDNIKMGKTLENRLYKLN